MTRTPSIAARAGLRSTLRSQSPRDAILRRHLAGGARKINVGKSVGSFVPKLAQKSFEKYGFSTVALLTDWAVIVGGELAQFTRPDKLKWPRMVSSARDVEAGCEGRPGATLVLQVEPARALDVEYGASQIVERINSYFGYRAVACVKIVQMPLGGREMHGNRHGATACGSQLTAKAGGADDPANGVDDLVAAVSDEKLRGSLQKLRNGLRGA